MFVNTQSYTFFVREPNKIEHKKKASQSSNAPYFSRIVCLSVFVVSVTRKIDGFVIDTSLKLTLDDSPI